MFASLLLFSSPCCILVFCCGGRSSRIDCLVSLISFCNDIKNGLFRGRASRTDCSASPISFCNDIKNELFCPGANVTGAFIPLSLPIAKDTSATVLWGVHVDIGIADGVS